MKAAKPENSRLSQSAPGLGAAKESAAFLASSPSLAASGGKHTDAMSTQAKCGAGWGLVATSQMTDTPGNFCRLAADKQYLRNSEENSGQTRIRKQSGKEAAINTES